MLGAVLLSGVASGLVLLMAEAARARSQGVESKQRRRTTRRRMTTKPGTPPRPTKPPDALGPEVFERPTERERRREPPPKPSATAMEKALSRIAPYRVDVKAKPRVATTLGPRAAAQQLFRYVAGVISAGKASTLGTKGNPNPEVKRLQLAMGGIRGDGIYGPATRARGKELLGREFPARRRRRSVPEPPTAVRQPPSPRLEPEPERLPPPAPEEEEEPEEEAPEYEPAVLTELEPPELSQRSPKRAALDLLLYVRNIGSTGRAAALGYKNHPSQMVKDAQRDMGDLIDDGIYGNKTRARGKALTQQRFPAR